MKPLAEIELRKRTGCNVVAIAEDGEMVTNPNPVEPLPAQAELVVIGDSEAQQKFIDTYPVWTG